MPRGNRSVAPPSRKNSSRAVLSIVAVALAGWFVYAWTQMTSAIPPLAETNEGPRSPAAFSPERPSRNGAMPHDVATAALPAAKAQNKRDGAATHTDDADGSPGNRPLEPRRADASRPSAPAAGQTKASSITASVEQQAATATAAREKREAAFAELRKLAPVITSDFPLPTDPTVDSAGTEPKVLGPISIEDLTDLSFALAVPGETVGDSEFKAWLEPDTSTPLSWKILTATRNLAGKKQATQLARVFIEDHLLKIAPIHPRVIQTQRFNLLRRSVLLVRARDPARAEEGQTTAATIQLVRPAATPPPLEMPFLRRSGGKKLGLRCKLDAPQCATVPPNAGNVPPAFPVNGTEITYEVVFPYSLSGSPEQTSYMRKLSAPEYCPLIILAQPSRFNDPPQFRTADGSPTLGITVSFSLEDGLMTVSPAKSGPGSEAVDLKQLSRLIGTAKAGPEFEALRGVVRVTVHAVTASAFDDQGRECRVVLATNQVTPTE